MILKHVFSVWLSTHPKTTTVGFQEVKLRLVVRWRALDDWVSRREKEVMKCHLNKRAVIVHVCEKERLVICVYMHMCTYCLRILTSSPDVWHYHFSSAGFTLLYKSKLLRDVCCSINCSVPMAAWRERLFQLTSGNLPAGLGWPSELPIVLCPLRSDRET